MKFSMTVRMTGLVLIATAFAGCSAEPETMRPEDTVFGEQVKAHNAAKQVEGMLMDSHADRDEELRKQGG